MGETVNFIDEKDIVRFKICQDCGKIARPLYHRARGGFDVNAHFTGDYVGKGGFAKAGGTVNQDVIESFAALLCRIYKIRFPLAFPDRHIRQRTGSKVLPYRDFISCYGSILLSSLSSTF
jgi:hypothetical protein